MEEDNIEVTSLVDNLILLQTVDKEYKNQTTNWFKDLCKRVIEVSSDVDKVFLSIEEEYKRKTGEKTMPNSYRSAKSVILKAISRGVHLHNEEGKLRGKTELEKAIRDSKLAIKETLSAVEKARSKLQSCRDLLGGATITTPEASSLRSHLSEVWDLIDLAENRPPF